MTNQFITRQQEFAREETAKHCHEAYDGLLQPEIIEGTIKYWNARTDAIIERVVTNTGEELTNWVKKEHSVSYGERARTLEELQKHITSVTGME